MNWLLLRVSSCVLVAFIAGIIVGDYLDVNDKDPDP